MKRLALALAVVAMAAACKKADEQPATDAQMTQDTAAAAVDTTKAMADTTKMAGDSAKM